MAVINPWTWGLGRRKSATARVRLQPGAGAIIINGKPLEAYVCTTQTRNSVTSALECTESVAQYDIFCNVRGGGTTGQAGAVSLGLARALLKINPATFDALRDNGLLTRDQRMKERKKYGRRGARRGFQFSKR